MKANTQHIVRIVLVIVCAALGFKPLAFGQREIGESPVAYRWRMATAERLRFEETYWRTVRAKTEFNEQIKAARAKFWETYPNRPGAEEAQKHFAELLYEKDNYYLILNQYPQDPSSRERSATGVADILDLAAGGFKVDNGIWPSAKPEFEAWADSFQKNLADRGGVFSRTFVKNILEAQAAADKEYQIYVTERDWAEFEAAGRIPAGMDTKETYGIALYIRRGRLSYDAAAAMYAGMTDVLGKRVVESAAEKLLAYFKRVAKAPTGDMVVTVPPPLKKTPDGTLVDDYSAPMPTEVFGTYRDPLVALEILATQDDDYRYLLWVLKRNAHPTPGTTKWAYAKTTADVLIRAFGRDDVLAAAHQVRQATKRLISGSIIDQKAIGATRNEPWEAFEDIVARKNPRGYVRAIAAFRQNPQSPGGVNVDAAYAKFIAGNNEAQVLDAAKKMALAKPNVTASGEIDALLAKVKNPQAFEKPEQVMVDFPKYLAWKKFPAGTKVTYVWRGLSSIRPGGEELMASRPSIRSTYTMDAINDDQEHLWLGEIAYDSPSGQAHSPHETEMAYPSKIPQNPGSARSAVPLRHHTGGPATSESTTSGEETLELGGTAIATHWEEVTMNYANKKEVTKTWTSEDVPSGLVRKTEMTVDGNRVYGRETLVESVHGTSHDFSLPRDPLIDGPAVMQITGLLPPSAISAPAPVAAPHVSYPSPAPAKLGVDLSTSNPRTAQPTPNPRMTSNGRAMQATPASAHSELLVRYSRLMMRYNRVRREMHVHRRAPGRPGEAVSPETQDARARLDAEVKSVFTSMRANDDNALTKDLDTLEATVADAEKSLGL